MTLSSLYLQAYKCAFQFFAFMLSSSVVSDSLWPSGLQPSRLLCPWGSSGKNTGVGCHALLQGIFLTQGLNLRLFRLLHWQAGSLSLVPLGEPFIFFFLVPNKYLCEIFINHVTSILGLLYVEVMLCPAQEQQAKVTSVIKTKSTFCSQAVCLWSYMKRSYFIPAHTKTLIGLALALIHTPFLSTLFSAIFTLFFPFSVLPFCEHLFNIYAYQALSS